MHELSIARNIVEIVTAAAMEANAARVTRVCLKLGALTCVHADALRFSFDAVTSNTLLQGCRLDIVPVPLVIHCEQCRQARQLTSIQSLICPVCQAPSNNVLQGRELEVDVIDVDDQLEICAEASAASSRMAQTLAGTDKKEAV